TGGTRGTAAETVPAAVPPGRLLRDRGGLDVVQFWEAFVQVYIAFAVDPPLRRTAPVRRPLAVAVVELIHDLHPFRDLAERRESHLVQVRVVPIIDEELRRPRVRTAGGERDESALVALLHRIVLDP